MTPRLVDTGTAGAMRNIDRAIEWRREPYLVSTDPERIDIAFTADFLATTYWAPEIS
jgi:hypothetical protein